MSPVRPRENGVSGMTCRHGRRRSRPLDVHGRAARGLADAAMTFLARLGQALREADGGGGFALAIGQGVVGVDGRHVDVLPVRAAVQPLQPLFEVHLGDVVAIGSSSSLVSPIFSAISAMGFIRVSESSAISQS